MLKQFLAENWLSVVIILVLVLYIVILIFRKKWDELRKFAYALMLSAEKIYKTEEGQRKFNRVLEALYHSIPSWLRIIISYEFLKEKLQEWYLLAKDILDDGVKNDSSREP